MALQFYYNPISCPSRSVRIFLKKTGILVEEHIIDLSSDEQHSPEFLKINPRHCVPVLKDGDYILTEGWAILYYVIEKFSKEIDDHWYPKDLRKRSRVNEYLSYHDGSTRQLFGKVFQDECLSKMRSYCKPSSEEDAKENVKQMEYVASQLQDTFLKDQKFLCGDEISIADILALAEVIQPTLSGRDTTKNHPKLAAWVERVKESLNPEFDEVYKQFYEVRRNFMASSEPSSSIERKVIQEK
ncbi:glutathione S-transferase theta-2-like isoform X3 [Apostichopus japonicus]|uniref:glutathione S-transferase theta-2-like isoform X3 n=1 Tax=Stichopus japonicus TaxID=307972 RepID=UPI003AB63298